MDDRYYLLLVGNEKRNYMFITHFATNLQHTAMGVVNDVCDHVGDSIHKAILSLSLFLFECVGCRVLPAFQKNPVLPSLSKFMFRNHSY